MSKAAFIVVVSGVCIFLAFIGSVVSLLVVEILAEPTISRSEVYSVTCVDVRGNSETDRVEYVFDSADSSNRFVLADSGDTFVEGDTAVITVDASRRASYSIKRSE